MRTQIVREGLVQLEILELEGYQAPGGDFVPSRTPLFYNPHMELSRDLSVLACAVFARSRPGCTVCDPLAGVGARGLRYAKETEARWVVLSDRSSLAQEFLRGNVKLNGLSNVEICGQDANALLHTRKFDLIDLDPFGSPAPFLDAACRSLRNGGLLMMTATDLAPLCGKGERACARKYSARPLRTEYCKELGMRILMGFAVRTAAKLNLSLRPAFCHATRHYFRVAMFGKRSRRETDQALREMGFVSHCFNCCERKISRGLVPRLPENCECGARMEHAGPLWLGPLGDPIFLSQMREELDRRDFRLRAEERRLLQLLLEECEAPPFHFSLHLLCSKLRSSSPKMERVIEGLRRRGFKAVRTHFSPDGLKTDAPVRAIEEELKR
ncbi:MAG: tRNA (guanine(10)-N(2))-dimethyltransferase [Candidatus Hadarchaeales archaeon]